MKKLMILCLIAAAILVGCASPTMETVSDVYVTQPPAEMMAIHLDLPDDAAEAVMQGGSGSRLYFCDGYELRLQTVNALSLNEALLQVTGFEEENLTVLKTRDGAYDRYDCAWCAAGEEGQQVGRTAILYDGNYYYSVTAMADSGSAFALTPVWQEILDSITLS